MRNNEKPANLFGNIEKDKTGKVTKPRPYYIRNKNIIIDPYDQSQTYRSINLAKHICHDLIINQKKIVFVVD